MTSPLLRAANPHPTTSEATSSSRLRRFGKAARAPLVLVALATTGLLVAGWLSETTADAARVDDCMDDRGATPGADLQIVDCGKPEARYKVVKVVRDAGQYRPCYGEGPEVFGSYTQKRSTSVVVLCLALNPDRPGGPVPLPNWPDEYGRTG